MTLTSSWIIKGAAWRRVGGMRSDEVRASALKLCQEACVWANELREEVLSQEAWPREGPVVLASPPHTHTLQRFTHHRSAGVITLCSQCQRRARMCTTRAPAVHAFISKHWHVTPNTCGTIKCGWLHKQIFLFVKVKHQQNLSHMSQMTHI